MTLGTYEGTHRAEMQGIAPTGKLVKFPVMTILMQEPGVTQRERSAARAAYS